MMSMNDLELCVVYVAQGAMVKFVSAWAVDML
jgi:hypothetical protein